MLRVRLSALILFCVIKSTVIHCVKNVPIRYYSGPHFSCIFPLSDWIRICIQHECGKMWKNADQNNYEHGHFLRSNRAQYKTKDVGWVKNQSENLKCISAEKVKLTWKPLFEICNSWKSNEFFIMRETTNVI